jgi:hypothetical protein
LSGVIDRPLQGTYAQILDEKFAQAALGVIAREPRRLCLENNKAGACGAGFANLNGKP